MDGTLQEPWSMLAWTVPGAWSARCRCLPRTLCSRIQTSWPARAPALSTDREQQKQHILTPVSAKATPAQCHAHHCSICGAARHTHSRACTHAHMCTRTHIQTQMCVCIHTGAHTHTHARAQNTGTHAHTHTRARAHTLTCTHAYTLYIHTLRA